MFCSPSITKGVVAGVVSIFSLLLQASEPTWWIQRGVIAKDGAGNRLPFSDYAAVNQGQLKNFLAAAATELEFKLPGGQGPILEILISSWFTSDADARPDFAAANVGQAKALSALIYDRLIAEGAASDYPWAQAIVSDSDYSLVNIGQVKALFAFNLDADTDGDGMGDLWEKKHFGDLSRDGTGHFDGDGLTDYEEWLLGTDPTSSDTDSDGMTDGWEVQNQLDSLNPHDASEDPDEDGWSNLEESLANTDPSVFNEELTGMTLDEFIYDAADRLNSIVSPAAEEFILDNENNILNTQ